MSEKISDVQERMSTVHQLESVISAMQGIAAARSRDARSKLDGVRAFAATIGAAIAEVLLLLPREEAVASIAKGVSAIPPPPTGDAQAVQVQQGAPEFQVPRVPKGKGHDGRIVIALCAEQGFAGSFNDHVLDAVVAQLAREDATLFLVGDRGVMVAAERGLECAWSAPMIARSEEAGPLAERITDALYARLQSRAVEHVSLTYAVPAAGGGADDTRDADDALAVEIRQQSLLPFDFTRFKTHARGFAPRLTLEPRVLLEGLVQEYVFAQLCEALTLSFAAENEARTHAMIAARSNVQSTLQTLTGDYQRLRQDGITSEIVELCAANIR